MFNSLNRGLPGVLMGTFNIAFIDLFCMEKAFLAALELPQKTTPYVT
jgi:hypothetical protein